MAEMSPLSVATNVFTAPGEAFAALRQRPSVWFPVALLIAAYAAISFAYMNSVDLAWFMDQQMSGNQMPAEQREAAVNAAAARSPNLYAAIGTLASTVFVLGVLGLTSLYYTGWSFATGDGVRLKQWFALLCWCSLPVVLGQLASIANVLGNDARFMLQDRMNPLALTNLLSIDTANATLPQRMLLGLDLTSLWSLVLTVLGYHAWTQRSIAKSAAIVLGPLALVVLIGTLAARS